MSVYKRAGSRYWWFNVCRGRGVPRLQGSTGKTDRKEAEAVEHVVRLAYAGKTPRDRLIALVEALTGGAADGLPLAGIADASAGWLRSTGQRLEERTVDARRRACARLAKWAAKSWPSVKCAGDVNRACAAGFAAWLEAKGTAGKTRRNVIGDLGTVWEGLRRVRDDVALNPWPLVLPQGDGERREAFTREQERAVMLAAKRLGGGWRLACLIARHTGLRYGDVARLRWADVDLSAGVVRVRPNKTKRKGIVVTVPLARVVWRVLERESYRLRVTGYKLGEGTCNDERVTCNSFVLPEHARWYPQPQKGPQGAFKEVLAAAGVKGAYTFHSWRHTFRTRLAEAGVKDEIAKRMGGWTEDATAARYDHDGKLGEMREAVERSSLVR